MLDLARKLYRNLKGGAAVEYGFLCALIVLAMIAAFTQLAGVTTNMWDAVGNKVDSAGS